MGMKGLKIKDFLAREGDRLGLRKQEDLARKLGFSDQTVSNWVKGKTFPTHETEFQLLEMGMTVEELFGKPYPSTVGAVDEEFKRKADYLARALLANIDKL